MTKTIEIGALCDPLSKQLRGMVSKRDAIHLDLDSDAITRCYALGYIPKAVAEKARRKLLAKCQTAVDRHLHSPSKTP